MAKATDRTEGVRAESRTRRLPSSSRRQRGEEADYGQPAPEIVPGATSRADRGDPRERGGAARQAAERARDGAEFHLPATSTSLTSIRQNTAMVNQRGKGAVLVVGADSPETLATWDLLRSVGYRCDIAHGPEPALEALQRNHYDLLITDYVLDGISGAEFLRRVRDLNPMLVTVVLTELAAVDSAVEAIKLGAADYLTRPIDDEALLARIEDAVSSRRALTLQRERTQLVPQGTQYGFEGIVYASPEMRRVIELCARVSRTDATVLITGESGTGKDLLAKAIHRSSHRSSHRFLAVNCAALSPQIIESELFGHEKGAFTGASSLRKGYFEHCHRGTIFLDEVGDIPMETQVKLLRVLENRVITRVGSNDPIPVDVRVISATHRDLENLVDEGRFRDDLYYRLKVVTVHLPPLRERPQDIPPLIDYFIRQYADAYDKSFSTMEPDALAALVSYPWKGNVRELKHTIENVIVVAAGPVIGLADLPENIRQVRSLQPGLRGSVENLVGMKIRDIEKELIRSTLAQVDGNRLEAARVLGIGERTLYRKLKRYGLS